MKNSSGCFINRIVVYKYLRTKMHPKWWNSLESHKMVQHDNGY